MVSFWSSFFSLCWRRRTVVEKKRRVTWEAMVDDGSMRAGVRGRWCEGFVVWVGELW